jgi:hypothetical protein
MITCEFCRKTFSRLSNLNNHLAQPRGQCHRAARNEAANERNQNEPEAANTERVVPSHSNRLAMFSLFGIEVPEPERDHAHAHVSSAVSRSGVFGSSQEQEVVEIEQSHHFINQHSYGLGDEEGMGQLSDAGRMFTLEELGISYNQLHGTNTALRDEGNE